MREIGPVRAFFFAVPGSKRFCPRRKKQSKTNAAAEIRARSLGRRILAGSIPSFRSHTRNYMRAAFQTTAAAGNEAGIITDTRDH
jgi:hypothetical protein